MSHIPDDIEYFYERALSCYKSGNIEEAEKCLKRIKLLEDALIIYKSVRKPDENKI